MKSSLSTSGQPKRLGNILVERGYLTVELLQKALEIQQKTSKGKLLGEILVEQAFCSEDHVTEGLAAVYDLPFAKLEPRLADPKVVELLAREYIEKNLVFPLFKIRQTLTVAVVEPSNLFLIDEMRGLTHLDIQIVATTTKDVRRMITTLPDSKTFVIDDIIDDSHQSEVTLIESAIEDIGDASDVAGQSPVIRLVNYMIYQAVREGASDIHIEPADRCTRVRHRIDGKLYKSLEVPLHLIAAITSRIKIMAGLDISERRLPQDGRVHVMLDNRKIDLRVSTFPGNRGEKTVIRVLDTKTVTLNLRDLGFAEDVLTQFQAQIRAPNGIALVTGPTGSGKSTTLYAALNEIACMENNICTVEDPIEYHLPLINQFQVQERIGLTFPKALRTLLRQDPDVIMVGEIRDEETARTAIQAALTGHLVFSTLHTNDAPSAITRLVNMGVEPYLIGAALNMVLAQRLVRKICSKCRVEYDLPRPMRKTLERMGHAIPVFYRGIGCKKCRNTGFSGRAGIHEILTINDHLRDLIVSGTSIAEIRRQGILEGMITLERDGFVKVREGLTSVEEVLQITGDTSARTARRASAGPATDEAANLLASNP